MKRWIDYLMSGGDCTCYQAWMLTIQLAGAIALLVVMSLILWDQAR